MRARAARLRGGGCGGSKAADGRGPIERAADEVRWRDAEW